MFGGEIVGSPPQVGGRKSGMYSRTKSGKIVTSANRDGRYGVAVRQDGDRLLALPVRAEVRENTRKNDWSERATT
jgi:hypothetical protein